MPRFVGFSEIVLDKIPVSIYFAVTSEFPLMLERSSLSVESNECRRMTDNLTQRPVWGGLAAEFARSREAKQIHLNPFGRIS
jgi:hypothetical protein